MKKLFFIWTLLFIYLGVSAQDPQFTQFYANPLYLNPAFAGTSIQNRFIMASRVQWVATPGAFQTYSMSYDQMLSNINSGIGFDVYYDQSGSGALSTTSARLSYAYEIKLNRNLFIRPALEFGFVSRTLDYTKLTFGDQLPSGNPITGEIIINDAIQYLDINTGLLIYSKNFWVGIAFHHINTPNEAFMAQESLVPMKFSLHGGYRFNLNSGNYLQRNYITVATNYKSQGKFDQLDLGFYYEHNALTLGLWYRGLPIAYSQTAGISRDAIAILIGYSQSNFNFAYSYDITISNLGISTGGSHEITLTIEWATKNKKRDSRKKIIPCPKF